MKALFGGKVYKVNVDAGFTCPNRDGTLGVSGCIYCNNEKFIVYFQPYTNTYAPVEKLDALYREALAEPSVIGLAIGTRPDAVDEDKLAMLEALAERYFVLIEYGLQSVFEKSLEFIHRGHDYRTFLQAVDLTKERGISIGAHIIAGFPTETREETLSMAEEISGLPVEFLKVHQLQVVKDTPLERMFREEPFHTFEYGEYLDFITDFIERTSPGVVFQRLFATAPDDILIAPHWGRNRHQILRDIEKRLEERDTFQGKKYQVPSMRP
jgi:radical SAM protein (TIGR01212 family)